MSKLDLTDTATLAVLTDMLTAAGVEGLEIKTADKQLRLFIPTSGKMGASSAVDAKVGTGSARKAMVKAPTAGQFQTSNTIDDRPFPRQVASNEVVGSVRIGLVLVPVIAKCAGLLLNPLVKQDDLVGYGDPLFEIELQR
ncbi:acetyl-CoA carboxylase [Rhizobium sp. Leaf262]|uniref:acetyl-CoA carboxylase n=1 Tax=Rhizobium sp. Leaf262 TaxID=1736312 RepID=UPI000B0FAA8C|nr:acetyl-CoA carboxylase [Rhizobium sp. Leaf262]